MPPEPRPTSPFRPVPELVPRAPSESGSWIARPSSSFRSVPDMWAHRVGSTPRSPALFGRRGGEWYQLTWGEADRRVRAISGWLLSRGLQLEERCAILAHTSVGWILADLGIQCAGAATTTIYPTSTTDDCRFILADSGSTILFCDTAAQASRIAAIRDLLPDLQAIVVFEGVAAADPFVVPLVQAEALGAAWNEQHPGALDDVRKALGPENLATVIYTSGTTGVPKGVMLTHDAWVYEAEAIDKLGLVTPADKQLLILPLAHVFARVMEITFIRLGVPTALDGNADRFLDNVAEVHPTFFAAVPRLFEKAYNQILREAEDAGTAQLQIFRWAVAIGRQYSKVRQRGDQPNPVLRGAFRLADRIVFSKIKARFGGHIRFMVSGGAPLPRDIAEFFHAMDLLVCEGYGLTESTAASTVNTPDDYVFGTVGRPMPGCQLRIADDGEILLHSRGVMKGYWRQPEATAEVLTADGWLKTGDIGRILPTGHLEITDRKKDLIVTAQGKNIAPAHFQGMLNSRSPLISHVLMHGDRRPFCSALVTLHEDAVRRWAAAERIPFRTLAELAARPEVEHAISQVIDDINRELPPFERVRRFAVLPEDFTVDNGLLTASLKPRRKAIEARWAPLLDSFYEGQRVAL